MKNRQKRGATEAAVELVARQVLAGLRRMDWEKWQREYVGDPKNLEAVVGILARLSREALAGERFREELRTQRREQGKRAPTPGEVEAAERRLHLR